MSSLYRLCVCLALACFSLLSFCSLSSAGTTVYPAVIRPFGGLFQPRTESNSQPANCPTCHPRSNGSQKQQAPAQPSTVDPPAANFEMPSASADTGSGPSGVVIGGIAAASLASGAGGAYVQYKTTRAK